MKQKLGLPLFMILAYITFLTLNKFFYGKWQFYFVILPVILVSIVYYFFVLKKRNT